MIEAWSATVNIAARSKASREGLTVVIASLRRRTSDGTTEVV